jgi:hypothetical protein
MRGWSWIVKMKADRKQDYLIQGHGTVMFVKADLGSGHHSFKVFSRKEGGEKGKRNDLPRRIFCRNLC